MTVCRICSIKSENRLYTVREMQFGTREEFVYFQCGNCGCLQLRDIPDDLAKFYPNQYGPFSPVCSNGAGFSSKLVKKYAKRKVVDHRLHKKGLLGEMFESMFGSAFIPYWLTKEDLNLSSDSKILDVGCGSGSNLNLLANIGFRRLFGVDSFIPSDITLPNGIRILRAGVESIDDSFDLIMLHHSFEHIAEPLRTLQKLYSLLKPGQYLLIRIPTCSSYAWEHYGENWAQIDAPRHLFLHSIESMTILARQGGLEISKIIFDSSAFQFWASAQYARDIPLRSESSYGVNPSGSIFSEEEICTYDANAAELNRLGLGDQACFYLRRCV